MTSELLRVAVVVISGMAVMAIAGALIAGCVRDRGTPMPTKEPNYPPFRNVVYPSPTQTPTATATATATPIPTLQPTATEFPTSMPTVVVASTSTPTTIPSATLAPTGTPEATSTLTATVTASSTARIPPTVTSTPSATPTQTPPPADTPSPSPTPNPLDAIRFVDNEDCGEGISRELLPTTFITIREGDASFEVVAEVADVSRERQQGLMCRETVPDGTGMLFVFESARALSFWMLNTYAPLDIVYLDESRSVVRAVRMESCPRPESAEYDAWRSACTAGAIGYGSGSAALYALELPAGWLASVGLDLENLEGVLFSW